MPKRGIKRIELFLKLSALKLFVKYMVSLRCKMAVKEELAYLGLHPSRIDLGVIELQNQVSDEIREKLSNNLAKYGLELLDDRASILVEQVKGIIIDLIYHSYEPPKTNYSDYISEKLQYDYTYVSNLFSKVKGMTIQQFIINHKVERVKELLTYGELNLTEIAYKMNYSSVAHLSNQFKKVTGLSPSLYKQSNYKRTLVEVI